jgi:tripartite-type tricarboxylate transporter receptor subunit TctC
MRAIAWTIASAAFALAGSGYAQDYPDKPIRLIVPFGAGGGLEIQARLIAQKIYESWRQPMVVDFRPGAASNVGAEIAAKSPADGYTLLLGVSNLVINPLIYANTRYDAQKDFAPITLTSTVAQILVAHASVPVQSVQDLVALAKTEKIAYAHNGIGSVGHLSAELFSNAAGIKMINVPYKGSGAAVTELLGGHVQLMFSAPGAVIQYVKSGRLKGLAVTGSQREGEGLDKVPTFAEAGYPTVEVYNWFGIFAPAGTPDKIVARLNREIVRIVESAEVRDRITVSGYRPVTCTPAEFRTFIGRENAKWTNIVKVSGVRAAE